MEPLTLPPTCLSGDHKDKLWAQGQGQAIFQRVVNYFDLREMRNEATGKLAKSAVEKMQKRELQLHADIRVQLQIIQLGEGASKGFKSQVKAASARNDFKRMYGKKAFGTFLKAMKTAKHITDRSAKRRERRNADRDADRPRGPTRYPFRPYGGSRYYYPRSQSGDRATRRYDDRSRTSDRGRDRDRERDRSRSSDRSSRDRR